MVHSFYTRSAPSGENRVVEDQVRVLNEVGHDVHLVAQETDDLLSPIYSVRTALGVATRTGLDPTLALEEIAPDVVHIHNLFPNIGTRWVGHWPGAVVHSIHNYRATCSNGLFYRDGRVCTDCSGGGATRAVRHRCYRGSALATLPVAVSRAGYRRDVLDHVDAIITTSQFSDAIFKQFVGSRWPTTVIPNFVSDGTCDPGTPTEPFIWLGMGRFSEEKGFESLVRDWPSHKRLLLIGDGPQSSTIEGLVANRPEISIRHTMALAELREVIGSAVGLVFPSAWFEADPQVVAEAMRRGLPVVARETNAGADTVRRSGAGATYSDARTLLTALDTVEALREQMSALALQEFQATWTRQGWLAGVQALYERVLQDRSGWTRSHR